MFKKIKTKFLRFITNCFKSKKTQNTQEVEQKREHGTEQEVEQNNNDKSYATKESIELLIYKALTDNDLKALKKGIYELQSLGYSIYFKNNEGHSLLQIIAANNTSNSAIEFVQFLIDQDFDPNDNNNIYHHTALHIAVIVGNYNLIEYLLKQKTIKYDSKDWEGRSPIEVAAEYDDPTAFILLQNHYDLEGVLPEEFTFINYKIIDTPGDGNCFFHAVARQLNTNGHNYFAKELRELAINYILEHQEEYQDFLAIDENDHNGEIYSDLNTYIDNMLTSGTWADNIIMQAIANALGIHITIMNENNQIIATIRATTDTTNTLLLQYANGNHYRAVEIIYELEQDITLTYNNNISIPQETDALLGVSENYDIHASHIS